MDKKYVIAISVSSAFVASLATAVLSAPSDKELVTSCLAIPHASLVKMAQELSEDLERSIEEAKAFNLRGQNMLERRDFILELSETKKESAHYKPAVQDANS
jgi:hypothetical protein